MTSSFQVALLTYVPGPHAMANTQAVSAFLSQQNYTEFASALNSSSLVGLLDGRSLTMFVPSDGALSSTSGFDSDVLKYHIVSGHWDLSGIGINDIHTILPTQLQGTGYDDVGNNLPQVLCVHRTVPSGNNAAVLEILNQNGSPSFIGSASSANITFYFIDKVLDIPAQYYTVSQNTNEMEQWQSLEVDAGGEDIRNFDGVTIFAPYDQSWVLSNIINSLQPHQILSVYNNHLISGNTVWSPSFTTGSHQSLSGFNYTFSLTQDGHYIVTLNGTSAQITTLDILFENGVIHLIDGPLWSIDNNTATEVTSSSTSTSTPNTIFSITSDSSTGTSISLPVGGITTKRGIPRGAVAGIAIAAIIALLSALIVLFGLWKRRAAHVKFINSKRQSIDGPGLPANALRTSPFTSTQDLAGNNRDMAAVEAGRSISTPVLDKRVPLTRSDATSANTTSVLSENSNRATSPPAMSVQVTEIAPLPVSEEVMERLLQTLAQRIDRGPVTQNSAAQDSSPPEYGAAH